ncbi:hypothetical protein [Vibrio nigripulchritudo]|uniref:hypothetical protein n=1 Tax=Vibrio nigripulchritudo TaxID=28173 RepID=UPI0012DA8E52|nr:hypothetical protein [Vibrio nigripulchritudo]
MIKLTIYTLILLASSAVSSDELRKVKEVSLNEFDLQGYGQAILPLSNSNNVLVLLSKFSNKILFIDDTKTKELKLEHDVSSYIQSKDQIFVIDNSGQLLKITPNSDITVLLQDADLHGRDFHISSDGKALYTRGLVIHSPFDSSEHIVKIEDLYPQFHGASFGQRIGITSGAMKHSLDKDTWLDVWNTETGQKVKSFNTLDHYVYTPTIVDELQGLVMFQWNGNLTLWNYKSDETLYKKSIKYGFVDVEKIGEVFRAYGQNNIQHLKVEDNQVIRTLLCEFKNSTILSPPQYTMDGHHALVEESSSEQSRFSIYDISENGCSKKIELPDNYDNYTLHPTKRTVITSNSKAVNIYSW